MPSIETLAGPARARTVTPPATPLAGLNGNRLAVHHGVRRGRFSVDAAGTTDLVVAAVNANNHVLSYAAALTSTTLPTLSGTVPSWWTAFTKEWTTVKANAYVWADSVSPQMTSIPTAITDYNALFRSNVQGAQHYAEALIRDPGNAELRAGLAKTLAHFSADIRSRQATVSKFMAMIDSFSTSLANDQKTLQQAVDDALATTGVNEAQIRQLAADIGDLKHQIAACNENIRAAEIGIEIGIAVGVAGMALALLGVGAGVFLIGAGVIGVGLSIVGWVVYQQKVQAAQAKVSADTAAMDALTQQVAALSTLNTSLAEIIALSQAAQKYVSAIAAQWNVVQIDIDAVVADLADAETELKSDDYAQIEADLKEATIDWDRLTAAVEGLTDITYTVSTTPVVIPAG